MIIIMSSDDNITQYDNIMNDFYHTVYNHRHKHAHVHAH